MLFFFWGGGLKSILSLTSYSRCYLFSMKQREDFFGFLLFLVTDADEPDGWKHLHVLIHTIISRQFFFFWGGAGRSTYTCPLVLNLESEYPAVVLK